MHPKTLLSIQIQYTAYPKNYANNSHRIIKTKQSLAQQTQVYILWDALYLLNILLHGSSDVGEFLSGLSCILSEHSLHFLREFTEYMQFVSERQPALSSTACLQACPPDKQARTGPWNVAFAANIETILAQHNASCL